MLNSRIDFPFQALAGNQSKGKGRKPLNSKLHRNQWETTVLSFPTGHGNFTDNKEKSICRETRDLTFEAKKNTV